MTALNKQALREAANAANIASWGKWESYKPHKGARGYEVKVGAKAVAQHCLKVDSAFIAAANPSTVLALLDELEAAEKRIAELSASLKDLIGVVNTVNRSRHHEIKMDDDDDPCYWQRKEWIEYLMETVSAAEDVYRTAGIGVKGD